MQADGSSLRILGQAAIAFCRHCPALQFEAAGTRKAYVCRVPACRLWAFLRELGLLPNEEFGAVAAEEWLRRGHAQEVGRFRGLLPWSAQDHDWEADARFNGLAPPETATNGASTEGKESAWHT
jgi:hypothetical protein